MFTAERSYSFPVAVTHFYRQLRSRFKSALVSKCAADLQSHITAVSDDIWIHGSCRSTRSVGPAVTLIYI